MKPLKTKLLYTLVCASLLVSLFSTQPVHAASFSVTTPVELIAAINTANSNGANDVITLTANITLTAVDNGRNGLPVILADGGHSVTIEGNGHTISRDGAAPLFRILEIASGAALTLNEVTISNGYCDGFGCNGGGLRNDGVLNISNSTISNNHANVAGGVFNTSVMTVTNSTFTGNNVGPGAGIYSGGGVSNSGTLTITNSTFSENRAPSGNSGGISNDGTLTITNSTFSGNSASYSGGIRNNGTLTITNSTFSGNSSLYGSNGGGISNSSTAILTNTIVANSTGSVNCYGTITNGGNNLQFGGTTTNSCGWGEAPSDPLGGNTLADNGGPTQTIALPTGSIAIDAGNAGACPSTDQRSVSRPQGGGCDIGAFEVDTNFPTVASDSLTATYASGAGPSNFTVTFNESVYDPAGDTDSEDVTNPTNYRIVEDGTNNTFNTTSCASGLGGDDTQVNVTSVTYTPNTATVNLSGALPDGTYRLFVCGTTSIVDPALNELNNGLSDYTFDFLVGGVITASSLPDTGFAPNRITSLPAQPANLAYNNLGDIWIEIPKLGVKSEIVGVPQSSNGWNVDWLGQSAGWLNGTAFPSWEGNSVLTGHVYDANGKMGPFANIKNLKHGDQIIVHLYGEKYIFEVRTSNMVSPSNTKAALEHLEDHSYLTLITCQGYNPFSDSYFFRRVVRAVLIEVQGE